MKKKAAPRSAPTPKSASALWRTDSAISFLSLTWLPSLALLGVAFYEIAHFLQTRDLNTVFDCHDSVLNGLSKACFVLAGLLTAWPALRQTAAAHVDHLSSATRRAHVSWMAVLSLAIVSWLGFIKLCQYWVYLLPVDSANEVNSAYTFLRTGSLEYSAYGNKVFAIHFFPLIAVFAPVLWIWNNPLALIFVQHIFVCSAPFALYALVYLLTGSSLAGFSGLLVALSSPYFFELISSNLHNASLCALFPWAMFCFYRRRWAACAALIALMFCCVEQVPFIFVGLGLYLVYALRDKRPMNWLYGCGLSAAAVVIWLLEMQVIHHYDVQMGTYAGGGHNWQLFAGLVPAGVPDDRIFREIIGHPLRSLSFCLSIYKFYPVGRLLFSMGFLGLLAPFQLLPFWTAALPHILSAPTAPAAFFHYKPTTYFDFCMHHSSYAFGPLLWATAFGIQRSYEWLSARGAQGWLLVWALFFSGIGFRDAGRTVEKDWRPRWQETMPPILALVPPKARLWVDEYASTPVSNRRWLQVTQWGPEEPFGYQKLFKPDYVVFDAGFTHVAKDPYRAKVITFLAQNHYAVVAAKRGTLLLRSPTPSAEPESTPEWIKLPEPDLPKAVEYAINLWHAAYDQNNTDAQALAKQGKIDHAIELLTDDITIDPKYYLAYDTLAVILASQGRYAEAFDNFSHAMASSPRDPGVHLHFGNLLSMERKFPEAAAQYRAALTLDPNLAQARTGLARVDGLLRRR